jgi:hypothetical protein
LPAVLTGLVLIVVGVFAITASLRNWRWFMEPRKAQIWINLFGRNGARGFYFCIGVLLVAWGIAHPPQ